MVAYISSRLQCGVNESTCSSQSSAVFPQLSLQPAINCALVQERCARNCTSVAVALTEAESRKASFRGLYNVVCNSSTQSAGVRLVSLLRRCAFLRHLIAPMTFASQLLSF